MVLNKQFAKIGNCSEYSLTNKVYANVKCNTITNVKIHNKILNCETLGYNKINMQVT